MKKILFLTAFVPNEAAAAEKNTKIMLDDLGRFYLVDLVYFKYDIDESYIPTHKNVRVLRVCKNSVLIKFLNVLLFPFIHPMFSVRFNWSIFKWVKKRIKEDNYSAIICDHSQMFLYAKFLEKSIPKILLSHDIIAQRVGRTSNSFAKFLCAKSESYCLNVKNAHIFSFSQKDCNLISDLYHKDANLCLDYIDEKIISAVPTCVTNEFIFIGKWSRADNLDGVLWFFKTVVPYITETVEISIIGKEFPKERIENKNPKVKVNILGFVDNPYPRIANCKAVLSPLFTGAGIKVKVVEALACGVPVIGTDIAFEGINSDYKLFMIVSNTPDVFLKTMKEVNISLADRVEMKKKFLNGYQSETIPNFLNNNL
ncbi:glycosyltransferase [Bacteroides sp.]|jgi:glycosyltransferase involved in cell wall biosynthesis|uniref:glycosyltransferase n=1 Tax=Bacteroides sp. TaxID=29523 RepID=UPI0025BF2336|nr:glycosyltransferase [Bacteroides sp.]